MSKMNIRLSHMFLLSLCSLVLANCGAARRAYIPDIAYVQGGTNKQKLDLFVPTDTNFATVVFMHGGGLMRGDRKNTAYQNVGKAFQAAGIGCAVISYRLGREDRWPAPAEDATSAFAWVKKNIEKYKGDERSVFLAGHSASGAVVALIATDKDYLSKHGLSLASMAGCIPMGTFLTDSLDVFPLNQIEPLFSADTGVLNLFGSFDIFKAANPFRFITGDIPPFLIMIAEAERFSGPVLKQAEDFARVARALGVHVDIATIPGRTHETMVELMSSPDDPTVKRIVQFVGAMRQ